MNQITSNCTPAGKDVVCVLNWARHLQTTWSTGIPPPKLLDLRHLLHTPTTLPPGRAPPIITEEETDWWISYSIWMFWLRQKSLLLTERESRYSPSTQQLHCLINAFMYRLWNTVGARGGLMVKALRYKPAGRGLYSRWCHWNFSVT